MDSLVLLFLLLLACSVLSRDVAISVDISRLGPWVPINQFFGCDEPNYAYYPHGQALLSELGTIGSRQTYFRTHNLLTTGDSARGLVGVPGLKWGSTSAYTEDSAGQPVYNFTIVDRIFDAYLAGGVKPYVEVGFMPLALASSPEPYFFDFDPAAGPDSIYTGWSHPPTSFEKWEQLVYEWAAHTVDRYGVDEVNSWYWEVWNEPNIACGCRTKSNTRASSDLHMQTGMAQRINSTCFMIELSMQFSVQYRQQGSEAAKWPEVLQAHILGIF